nr:retrovirus-related Pol polyprotein from transposon TNT 1-94 [Tanacetum cinerariifolium]
MNNDDDQEIFHDAIESASENFIENHSDSQKDYDKSDVDHNDSEEKEHLVDKKGIGFENPSYFEKAKDLRPTLYDEKIVQICLWIIDSGCSKHMTGNRALLMNFVEKFLGTELCGKVFQIFHQEFSKHDLVMYEPHETKLDEVIPFEKQSDDLKKRLAKNNEAKVVIYNALPRKEYERIFMCNMAKESWKTLLITHHGYPRKNYVMRFLKALHPKWRAKVTAIEDSKDLTSLSLDELIGNLKAKKESSEKSVRLLEVKTESTPWCRDDKNSKSDRKCFRCDDLNHLIGECPKPSKDKNQRAFIRGSWSDSSDEDDEKVKNETCLIAQASNETRFLKDKTKAFNQFKIFSKKIQNQLGCTIVSIIIDHGKEFDNEVQFREFCNDNEITHDFSAPRTPQSNGVVKRKNRTLQEMSRTMLNEQSLPQKFWCNAIDTSTNILNRILIRGILGKTPYELLKGRKATLDYFKVFGSKFFILNTKDYLTKFDPKSYEADESWIVDTQEELNQFIANDIWELVPQPRNMTIIGTKWVFRNKLDENGIVSRNKAWLVAQGYNQQKGISYDETYALVARLESIMILLAYACALEFKLFQMDVKSAFLNSFINKEVYVAQTPGFIDFEKLDHVYKVKKALYGLKQAPKAWTSILTSGLSLVPLAIKPLKKLNQNTCQRTITELVHLVEPHDLLFIAVDREHYCLRRLSDGIIMLELEAFSIPSWFSEVQLCLNQKYDQDDLAEGAYLGLQSHWDTVDRGGVGGDNREDLDAPDVPGAPNALAGGGRGGGYKGRDPEGVLVPHKNSCDHHEPCSSRL